MAIFDSSNPTLKEKTFERSISGEYAGDSMTLNGTLNKFGVLMALMAASTFFAWDQFQKGSDPSTFMMVGVFGGLIMALIMMFKMSWSPVLAPGYAVLEGLFLGAFSAYLNDRYPGLPMQAVFLTLLVAGLMFLIYRFRIIPVTQRFRQIIVVATMAVAIFYLVQWIGAQFFGSTIAGGTMDSSAFGIGFSVFVVVLASLNLLLNFDMIEKGAEMQAPKFMEWYSAFGLLVTLVWLYLEILRLLTKLQRR
ncbi:MAG: Bax inhibitor-1/YccA family protein [Bacteroidetes bacterium]|nr:Bax inhibitor-1/YccA family protein [Bacteroidota bacterium]